MKSKKVITLCVFLLVLIMWLSACSKSSKETASNKQSNVVDKPSNTSSSQLTEVGNKETVINISSTANSNVVRDPSKPLKRIGNDNSQILTTYDGAGTMFEERYFQNSNKIHSIVVETKTDGSVSGRAYARDGKVKDLSSDMIQKALSAPGDDLAYNLGFTEFQKKETIATTSTPLPNTQVQVNNPASPTQNQPSTVNEETKKDSSPKEDESKPNSQTSNPTTYPQSAKNNKPEEN